MNTQTTPTTNRQLQLTAARVLTRLLDTPGLPEVWWHVNSPGEFTDSYASQNLDAELLEGQADSQRDVRDWAEHLDTHVALRRGTTPEVRAVVDGIVVRVWCASEDRDDVNVTEE